MLIVGRGGGFTCVQDWIENNGGNNALTIFEARTSIVQFMIYRVVIGDVMECVVGINCTLIFFFLRRHEDCEGSS